MSCDTFRVVDGEQVDCPRDTVGRFEIRLSPRYSMEVALCDVHLEGVTVVDQLD